MFRKVGPEFLFVIFQSHGRQFQADMSLCFLGTHSHTWRLKLPYQKLLWVLFSPTTCSLNISLPHNVFTDYLARNEVKMIIITIFWQSLSHLALYNCLALLNSTFIWSALLQISLIRLQTSEKQGSYLTWRLHGTKLRVLFIEIISGKFV